jgi:DNA topoisomerase-3
MSKTLIITEKPSVARDVTEALGGFKSVASGDYFESDKFVCSYAVGHLFTFLEPQEIDPRFKRWDLNLLPIVPKPFQLKPGYKQTKRISVLKKLLERSDIGGVINACDAAREGELIFREIIEFTGCTKPTQRLWLQSMTEESIRNGFANLKPGSDYDGLGYSASCRARSDWLIGMNATRAMSKRLQTKIDRKPWSVGRVQTPTLALLVERELEILSHIPEPFFRVKAQFKHTNNGQAHEYEGTWFDPTFRSNELKPQLKDDRLFDRVKATAIIDGTCGKPGLATETREESRRNAPPLFSLTSLQKTMNMRYKWNAQRTLKAAQRCYEQHKVLTYPRTSSTCLPNDYRGEVDRLVKTFATTNSYGEFGQQLLKNGLKNTQRTFNDGGVTDHFAIIPTGSLKHLSGDDGKLFDAVVRRFLSNFFPQALYDKVKRLTVVEGEHFRTGPVETLKSPGWLAVYGKSTEKEASSSSFLAPLEDAQGTKVITLGASLEEKETQPPPRITEAKLLSLMEFAGRHVDNEDLARVLMKAEGLGTAATRADIIQNLIIKEYVDTDLRPYPKGIRLIETLKRLDKSLLTSAELTAGLEVQLGELERCERDESTYMANIIQYTKEIVAAAKEMDWKKLFPNENPLGECPNCQKQVYERPLSYACDSLVWPDPGCGWQVWKEILGRYVDPVSIKTVLKDKTTHLLDGFRRKQGQGIKASLVLTKTGVNLVDAQGKALELGTTPLDMSVESDSGAPSHSGKNSGTPVSDQEPLGSCPIHKGDCVVIETAGAYVCATRRQAFVDGNPNEKGILLAKVMCKRTITRAEALAFITDGATPFLKSFTSKKGKPFEARLTLTPSGKPAFDFPPRRQGATGASSSGAKKKTYKRKKTRSRGPSK